LDVIQTIVHRLLVFANQYDIIILVSHIVSSFLMHWLEHNTLQYLHYLLRYGRCTSIPIYTMIVIAIFIYLRQEENIILQFEGDVDG